MEIVVKGRRTAVPERFRTYALDKLGKVERYDHKVERIDVELIEERNPRQSAHRERVELTVRSRGPVIRAEAAETDCCAAFDVALDRLESRLRRAAERRRGHSGRIATETLRTQPPPDLGPGPAEVPVDTSGDDEPVDTADLAERRLDVVGEGPLIVREKRHTAAPMGLDEALWQMELVGHDFYLFVDKESGLPSVVYRRRGYDFGVIAIDQR